MGNSINIYVIVLKHEDGLFPDEIKCVKSFKTLNEARSFKMFQPNGEKFSTYPYEAPYKEQDTLLINEMDNSPHNATIYRLTKKINRRLTD
jgi:hypothetical protein